MNLPVIEDFTTPPKAKYRVAHGDPSLYPHADDDSVKAPIKAQQKASAPSILGTHRFCSLVLRGNPLKAGAVLGLGGGNLSVALGAGAYGPVRLYLGGGGSRLAKDGPGNDLALDLSPYNRFVVHFGGATANVRVQLWLAHSSPEEGLPSYSNYYEMLDPAVSLDVELDLDPPPDPNEPPQPPFDRSKVGQLMVVLMGKEGSAFTVTGLSVKAVAVPHAHHPGMPDPGY